MTTIQPIGSNCKTPNPFQQVDQDQKIVNERIAQFKLKLQDVKQRGHLTLGEMNSLIEEYEETNALIGKISQTLHASIQQIGAKITR